MGFEELIGSFLELEKEEKEIRNSVIPSIVEARRAIPKDIEKLCSMQDLDRLSTLIGFHLGKKLESYPLDLIGNEIGIEEEKETRVLKTLESILIEKASCTESSEGVAEIIKELKERAGLDELSVLAGILLATFTRRTAIGISVSGNELSILAPGSAENLSFYPGCPCDSCARSGNCPDEEEVRSKFVN